MQASILFEDEYLVVANKPAGLLVHKSTIDKYETEFLLQQLRDLVDCFLYPVHRLDKPTSGVIAFAKTPEVASQLQIEFSAPESHKRYWLICRGFVAVNGIIDHPLKPIADFKRERKNPKVKPAQEAQTCFRCLAQAEINAAIDKYPQSRFSLVEADILTGRKHQIRRHFKHISHPIIGCPKYGKSRYNQYFSDVLGAPGLMLHAKELEVRHPVTGHVFKVAAPIPERFVKALDYLGIKPNV